MIDEKKLIEKLDRLEKIASNYRPDVAHVCTNLLCEITDFINEQPKIGEWIPVEERLPNVYKTVLITTYNQEVRTAFLDGEHYWFSGLFTYTFDDVLAWKPLPEPYKGETK